MIINESLLKIDEQIDQLVESLMQSEMLKEYLAARKKMCQSLAVQEKQRAFLQTKEQFARVAEYGTYAPDFREKQRAVHRAKRALDLVDEVAAFRLAETQVQAVLDTIGQSIAQTISESIKIDAGNPFFEEGKHNGCGGHCHASE